MLSLFDFLLCVHRAVWFPLNTLLGLEAQGVELPVELAPRIAEGAVTPRAAQRLCGRSKRPTRPAASW